VAATRERERKQRKKREDFFGYHVQFVRRYNRSVTASDLRSMWDDQGGLCALTGRLLVPEAGQSQVDHIVPQTRGGSHDLTNLRWVCSEANHAKRNLTDEEFLALCVNVAEWIGSRLAEAYHCDRAPVAPESAVVSKGNS
jgi:5-methylcytosine-specific restriction endonuclease McrA